MNALAAVLSVSIGKFAFVRCKILACIYYIELECAFIYSLDSLHISYCAVLYESLSGSIFCHQVERAFEQRAEPRFLNRGSRSTVRAVTLLNYLRLAVSLAYTSASVPKFRMPPLAFSQQLRVALKHNNPSQAHFQRGIFGGAIEIDQIGGMFFKTCISAISYLVASTQDERKCTIQT